MIDDPALAEDQDFFGELGRALARDSARKIDAMMTGNMNMYGIFDPTIFNPSGGAPASGEAPTAPKPTLYECLGEADALEVLIPCIRESAQDTLDALKRRGIAFVRLPK